MEGFEFFISICLGMSIIFIIGSFILQKIFPQHAQIYPFLLFALFIGVSFIIIMCSFLIGKWIGIGMGLIGLSLLIGTILGLGCTFLLTIIINYNKKDSS